MDRRSFFGAITGAAASLPFMSGLGRAAKPDYVIRPESVVDRITRNVRLGQCTPTPHTMAKIKELMGINVDADFVMKLNLRVAELVPEVFDIRRIMKGPVDELVNGKIITAKTRILGTHWTRDHSAAISMAVGSGDTFQKEVLEIIAQDIAWEIRREAQTLADGFSYSIAPYIPVIPSPVFTLGSQTITIPTLKYYTRYGIVTGEGNDVEAFPISYHVGTLQNLKEI